jgi:hypothetical protein
MAPYSTLYLGLPEVSGFITRRCSHVLEDPPGDFSVGSSQVPYGVKECLGVLWLRCFINDQAGNGGCLFKGPQPGVHARSHHQKHDGNGACCRLLRLHTVAIPLRADYRPPGVSRDPWAVEPASSNC